MTANIEQLRSLAERLAGATGPGREIDLALWALANNCRVDRIERGEGYWFAIGWTDHIGLHPPMSFKVDLTGAPKPECGHTAFGNGQVAQYTLYIDGGLALVERLLPGWSLDKLAQYHENDRKVDLWGCVLLELLPYHEALRLGQQDVRRRARADAQTPALAILSALVSALIAQAESTQ